MNEKKANKVRLLLIVGFIVTFLLLVSWLFPPKKNKSIDNEEILENEKISFNVSLDTLETSFKGFPKREEVNIIENNPFLKAKEESDEIIEELLNEMEKEENSTQIETYQKELNTKKEEEETPFAFYEADDMSGKGDNNNENSKGFEQLLRIETSGKQIVSKDNPYLKVRLLEDFTFNGNIIPRNTYLMANATFSNNRVFFTINGIQIENKLMETDMEIYDTYGNKGLELTKGKTRSEVVQINQELSQEYDRQTKNRGGGFFRELLRAKPKLVVENKEILLKVNNKK